jgi:hypothetical protein
MVVLSLSITIVLARPRSRDVAFSSLRPDLFADDLAAGQDRDVFEHRLAAIAEARGLDGADLQRAAELVHDERREGFAFDVLGDDHEGLALLGDLLEDREQVLHRGDLLVVDQDVARLRARHHLVRSVTKYGER